MTDVFQFKPQTEITAEENLRAFINKCRDELTVFGSELDWNAHVWPKIAVFAKLAVTTRKPTLEQLMDEDFVEFAKAYFRYQQGHKPTGTKNELVRRVSGTALKGWWTSLALQTLGFLA